jgi:predicted glycoside hydrolase/deacetylase ChbG (UPF0249 family)
MVCYPAASEAAVYAREHPRLSVGLHFDVSEWHYDGSEWQSVYQRVDLTDGAAIAAELHRQLDLFQQLVGAPPTHLDSHQHIHLSEPARSLVLEYARDHGLAVRGCDERVKFCGDFYGQTGQGEPFPEALTVEKLIALLQSLPAGWTELGCHPGYALDWETVYASERQREIETLCDPALRTALRELKMELRSFRDLPRVPIG